MPITYICIRFFLLPNSAQNKCENIKFFILMLHIHDKDCTLIFFRHTAPHFFHDISYLQCPSVLKFGWNLRPAPELKERERSQIMRQGGESSSDEKIKNRKIRPAIEGICLSFQRSVSSHWVEKSTQRVYSCIILYIFHFISKTESV